MSDQSRRQIQDRILAMLENSNWMRLLYNNSLNGKPKFTTNNRKRGSNPFTVLYNIGKFLYMPLGLNKSVQMQKTQ